MKNFDLHMHSKFSKDGEFTPKRLIQFAKEKDIQCVALCDHDCMLGIDEMIQEGQKEAIRVIPAIEFSTLFQPDVECHLLGYGFDYKQDYFLNLHEAMQKLADDAFHIRVQKLEEVYPIHIDKEQILKDANGENPWFLMCERIFSNPDYAHIEDFKEYIKGGSRCDPAPVNFFWDKCQKGSPLYVPVDFPSFKDTIDIIHQAGGIAVLAHPFRTFYHKEDLLELAISFGIDGIEAYSNYHTQEQNAYYATYAMKHNILMTCGSDFHGKHKPSVRMGEYGEHIPNKDAILEAFLNKLK